MELVTANVIQGLQFRTVLKHHPGEEMIEAKSKLGCAREKVRADGAGFRK